MDNDQQNIGPWYGNRMIPELEKMQMLNEHLRAIPPKKLYHYTSTDAFRCIVENAMLWATDAFYMNDKSELLHAFELFKDVCLQLWGVETDPERKRLLDLLHGELRFQTSDQPHIFAISFSESRDQLSQWRAYTRNGGYAVSFNGPALTYVAKQQGYLFAKCIYSDAEKKAIIREFITAGLERVNGEPNLEMLSILLANEFLVVAAMMKHVGFAEENEWRLISTTSRSDPTQIKYRTTARYLVPYLQVDLKSSGLPSGGEDGRRYLGFDEVLVAPAPEPELSWRSCMQLLHDRNVYFEQITPSGTPFRS